MSSATDTPVMQIGPMKNPRAVKGGQAGVNVGLVMPTCTDVGHVLVYCLCLCLVLTLRRPSYFMKHSVLAFLFLP